MSTRKRWLPSRRRGGEPSRSSQVFLTPQFRGVATGQTMNSDNMLDPEALPRGTTRAHSRQLRPQYDSALPPRSDNYGVLGKASGVPLNPVSPGHMLEK